MESFETFINTFRRALEERNAIDLRNILENSQKHFQNVSKDDCETIFAELFNNERGFLHFLNTELNRSKPQKSFDAAVKEGFEFLKFIIEQFYYILSKYESYIINIKDTCRRALIVSCSCLIKRAAANAYVKLIELLNKYLNFQDELQSLPQEFQKLDVRERSIIFSVLGAIAKHSPETVRATHNFSLIFHQLQNDFRKQYKPDQEHQPPEIEIYLNALSNFLEEASDEVEEKYWAQMYNWAKNISSKDSKKKVTMRAAINLLSTHIFRFRQFIYSDYAYWYNFFMKMIVDHNKEQNECGQRALRKFCQMIGDTLKEKHSENDKAIFMYFKEHFEKHLEEDSNSESGKLQYIVYGYSQMAGACKTYLTSADVRRMFSLIAQCARPLFMETLKAEDIKSISHYQEALSEIILHMDVLSVNEVDILTKLSVLSIKKFPDLPVTSHTETILSLKKMILNISTVHQNRLKEFLSELTLKGIIWTCSHTLLIDAELQREQENLEERPVTYKNYLPLWTQLVKFNTSNLCNDKHLMQEVVDTVIYNCITIIEKLNLSTEMRENDESNDGIISESAVNKDDFRIFINIVDLYVDILNIVNHEILGNTIDDYLTAIIKLSYKHSQVSGFYKLARQCCKHIDKISTDDLDQETLEFLHKYLIHVLDLVPTLSNELLTSCLYLILDTPIRFVQSLLDYTITTFKIAFAIGLSDFELAYTALNTLEKWTSLLDKTAMSKFLREIVSTLEPHLHTEESIAEFSQDILKREKKTVKRVILMDKERTLENFQRRILLYIASLDTDIMLDFVHKRSMETGATWDKKDLLKSSFPLSDVKIDVYFDNILPRVLILAEKSGDRKTKIAACEVLHVMVAFVLGKTSESLSSSPERYLTVYKRLFPILLNLSCDTDEIARQIFQPLMMQISHWLSSKFMLESPITLFFLESLFEGLCSESNPALKEISGICLAEFTKWSIKQSSHSAKSLPNIDAVISKMINFALHPSSSKRVAAAVAFNHLYTILREEEEILTKYWIVIFYSFIKSLDGCNDRSINIALSHVERVLMAKDYLFNETYHRREKPDEFESATLLSTVNWLLLQCGSLVENLRKKCMEQFLKLSKHVEDHDSANDVVMNYINEYGIESLHQIILKGIHAKIDQFSTEGTLPLLRSLDFYIWLMSENLVPLELLFSNEKPENEVIFNCINTFFYFVLTDKSKHIKEMHKVIIAAFNFIRIILQSNENFVPAFLLGDELCELISAFIMQPVLDSDVDDPNIIKTYSSTVQSLLDLIMQKGNPSAQESLKRQLEKYIDKYIDDFIQVDKFVHDCVSVELKQYVKGLITLQQCRIFDKLSMDKEIFNHRDEKIARLSSVLCQKRIGELVYVNIKPAAAEYFRSIMELLLMHYEVEVTKTLVRVIMDNTTPVNATVPQGQKFLELYQHVIFTYMLNDVEKTFRVLDDILLQENPPLLLTIVESMMLFVRRHRKELQGTLEDLVKTLVKKFSTFERTVNNVHSRREKLISIFTIAVQLVRKPSSLPSVNAEFHKWILYQLTRDFDKEYKVRILEGFLPCLTDMTTTNNHELIAILYGVVLKDNNGQSAITLKQINCFQTLVTLLSVTKSIIVFEAIILSAAGNCEQLWSGKTEENLMNYFHSIPSDCVLRSLERVYKLFMDINKSINERFDILNKFCIPSFEYCSVTDIKKFFEQNIKEIATTIKSSLVGTDIDVKQLMVSKIGCYNLVGIMFAKIPINEIDSPDSSITKAAVENVQTGKELLLQLYSSAMKVRELSSVIPEQRDLMRLLHCSAYNCCIAIVSLKNDEDSYLKIFAESYPKKRIWENIIDCNKEYNFQQTFREYPKYRKKLVNIRRVLKEETGRFERRHIHTYDVSLSTLNEDIKPHDFNDFVVQDESVSSEKQQSMSVGLESDEFNNHECMASICGVLQHMEMKSIISATEDPNSVPKWLKCFFQSVIQTTNNNVRLFMLKIIWNQASVFSKYAKFCLSRIIHTINLYLKDNPLNYIITDMLMILIEWHKIVVPDSTEEKDAAQKLWERIIQKATISNTNDNFKAIYNFNMSIVKSLLEVWQKCLKLPKNLNEVMKRSDKSGIYLILICFENGMKKEIVENPEILQFIENSLDNWQNSENIYLQTCECVGLILEYFSTDEKFGNKASDWKEKIQNVLLKMQSKNEGRVIKCIYSICKAYNEAAIIYYEFITANIAKVDNENKTKCLEILLRRMKNLSSEILKKELGYMQVQHFLKNKIQPCDKVALKIISEATTILAPEDLLPSVHLILPYIKNNSSEYRKLVYHTFMNLYKKYSNETSNNNDVVLEIKRLSNEVLLQGLLDPDEELQEEILTFWTEPTRLSNASADRLLEIFNTYVPNSGDSFLPFILIMILDLTTKSLDYKEPIFKPLHECNFINYKIVSLWRTKTSVPPLYAPSLVSEMNQTFTQMSSSLSSTSRGYSYGTSYNFPSKNVYQFRATQEPEFEPTIATDGPSLLNTFYEDDFQSAQKSRSVYKRKSPRFLNDPTRVTEEIRQSQIKKNIRYQELRKDEVVRQRNAVKVYRQYRLGEFPDIEISLNSIVEALKQLVKKDQQICKDLTVCIFCALYKQNAQEDFVNKVATSLKEIIQKEPKSNSVTATILEILLQIRMYDVPSNTITQVSTVNGLNFHGTLVLEEMLIYGVEDSSPPTKKQRTETLVTESPNKWLQLSNLYESVNDIDLVLSIFQNHINDKDMQEAAFAQAANLWEEAKDAYTKVYERGEAGIQKHSLQGLFECANNLCRWSQIDKHIQNCLNGDLNNIWNHSWKNWMLPWLFEVQVQKLLHWSGIGGDKNLSRFDCETIHSWLQDEQKIEHIKRFFGEETAMMFAIFQEQQCVSDILARSIDEMRRQWIRLHPLSTELRIRKLQKLRRMNDINVYMNLLKEVGFNSSAVDVERLTRFWSSSVPSKQDFILLWDRLTSRRLYFASLLEDECMQTDDDTLESNENSTTDRLNSVSLNMQLNIIKAALDQKHKFIAEKYLKQANKNFPYMTPSLKDEFLLTVARTKYLNGEMQLDINTKMEYFKKAWDRLHKLLKKDECDQAIKIHVSQELSKLSSHIADICRQNVEFADLLVTTDEILDEVKPRDLDIDNVINALEVYSFNHLKEYCNTQDIESVKIAYLALTRYCYNMLSLHAQDTELQKEFVRSTLKGMLHGSLECAHYFPCLLKVEYFKQEEIREIFTNKSKCIETWMFLSWQAQLFSHLATEIASFVIPIIEKIANTYPNAIIYTLSFAMELHPILAQDSSTYEIRKIIYDHPEIEKFLKAMQYVVQPEFYLRYHLKEFKKNLALGTATAIETLLKAVYRKPQEYRNNPRPGSVYTEIGKYEREIKALASKKTDDIKTWVENTCRNLAESLQKRRDRLKLKDYSPWLCGFNGNSLEIPGQYSGTRKPMPQYHARIVKMDPLVKVMQSLRKPIRVTMIGNNGKEYNFLVKFGEDLRQDQRLQQVFSVMNKTLEADATCKQRMLSIVTYQVIPLSKSLGLIEWIEETKCLQNLIDFTLSFNQLKHYEDIRRGYEAWIRKAAPAEKLPLQYKEALFKYKASAVISQMKECISKTEWDLLRNTFKILSPCVEGFITLRRNFVISYATMCIAHWILGIGDRHLENTLVIIGSGKCLGIDFNLAFDAGVDLPVPELVPFRLTPQILGLLKPFTEKDLLRATMVHVLRVLRRDQGPILACMEVFVHEPLNWVENVNKALMKDGSNQADVKWLPQKKIDIVTKKLNGIKPSIVTVEQLKEQHHDKYYERYYTILNGDDDVKQIRATLQNDSLSTEDQITCLLDQAIDLNILGRSYVNWKPWL